MTNNPRGTAPQPTAAIYSFGRLLPAAVLRSQSRYGLVTKMSHVRPGHFFEFVTRASWNCHGPAADFAESFRVEVKEFTMGCAHWTRGGGGASLLRCVQTIRLQANSHDWQLNHSHPTLQRLAYPGSSPNRNLSDTDTFQTGHCAKFPRLLFKER